MGQSRIGDTVVFIGGVQIALSVAAWIGTLVRYHREYTWFAAVTEASLGWVFLIWSGVVLAILGLGLRSNDLQAIEYSEVQKAVITGAAIVGILGLISTVLIVLPFAI